MEGKLGRISQATQEEVRRFLSIEMLPSKENLMASFPHKEGCLAEVPLIEGKLLFSHQEGFMPAVFGSGLTCQSCHVSQRYREE